MRKLHVVCLQGMRAPLLHYFSLFDAKCSFAFLPQQGCAVTLILHFLDNDFLFDLTEQLDLHFNENN